MNPLQFLKLMTFILSQGPDVIEQLNQLIKFARSLKEKYEAGSASIASMNEADLAAIEADHEKVVLLCAEFECECEGAATIAARPSGVFKDLFKDIIDDPQKYIDLFMLFKTLFGLKAQAMVLPPSGPPAETV